MNGIERYICSQQKEIYEYAYSHNADICKFSDAFLNSDFCNRSLDKPYSVDQFADIVNWLEFLEWENIKVVPEKDFDNRCSLQAAGWCGFTYRQLQIETGIQSRDLSRKVPVEKLLFSYPGLHTLDEEVAADIIRQDFFLDRGMNVAEEEEEYAT